MYLLKEVQKVYRSQGQNIHDKHFEVIIRKMMSKVQLLRPGDTNLIPGDLVDRLEIKHTNDRLRDEGKRIARSVDVLLGITKASSAPIPGCRLHPSSIPSRYWLGLLLPPEMILSMV
jgi:DNA-directed RNA polymerase subunit beta'